jgi:hypothetical protein
LAVAVAALLAVAVAALLAVGCWLLAVGCCCRRDLLSSSLGVVKLVVVTSIPARSGP